MAGSEQWSTIFRLVPVTAEIELLYEHQHSSWPEFKRSLSHWMGLNNPSQSQVGSHTG